MYTEKKELMGFLEKFSKENNLDWDYNYMYQLSSAMSRRLDEFRFLDKDEFIELLEHNYGNPENYKDIDFDDEVMSIEYAGEEELIDIEVSEDNLFYANGILTHNSAFGNVDVGMENVSESIGLAATADTMVAMIATEQMREQNQVLIKFLKNRNTGMLNSVMLQTEYNKMRYTDWIDENGSTYSQQEINTMAPETFHNAGIDVGQFKF